MVAKKEICCSFCNTPESEVKKLISNQEGKYICDGCVIKFKKLTNSSANGVIRPTIQQKGS